MDAENINYLVGKIRILEKKNGRLIQKIDAGHESFRVHRKEIEELEFQLKHKIEVIEELEKKIKQLETMIIKLEVTEQDFVDIQTINNGLNEASHYIVEIVGKSNLEQHHKEMLDSIEVAQEWLNRIKE